MWQAHEYHFSFSVGSSSGDYSLVPFVVFGVGAGLFANGFWNYRKLRVIEDTPRTAIRSVPMGLVHVRGKAGGDFRLTSPVTRTPCYYYRVRLERWDEQGKNSGWAIVHTATEGRVFSLEDETGKVLVNPRSAEYDLPQVYCGAFGPHASSGPYLDPSLNLTAGPSEEDLRAYAAKTDPLFKQLAPASGFSERIEERKRQALDAANPLSGHGSYRITEQCVVAEREYEVIGTCAQNAQSAGDDDRNIIVKGQNEPTFVISGFAEVKLEKILRKRALTRIVLGGLLMVFMMAVIIQSLLRP